ncbi:chemotaxis protein CheW [Aliikangiella sp. G2MR2-5]|uniref:chemotaxis protein CheW n=1 Tax=Aliikangiella sp. G2MR2-5 TaxID=2788943 RepID=UPI0018A8D04C|nr:chemotaxis protein CheW [Aliikangiella sp. G2MR2-5]
MSETDLQAFETLKQIEKRSFESAEVVTREEDLSRFWTGIGFRVSGNEYVVQLKEVAEIIAIPRYTKVPGAKTWVRGLANIRGTLLPIMDLHGFLGRKAPHALRRQRLLVVNHDGIHCGVIVDEVLGLNHFENEEWVKDVPVDDEAMKPYLKGGFYVGENLRNVFSLHTLAETPSFRQVALV